MAYTAEQRRERASRAGKQAQSVSTYVKSITRNAAQLTAEDLEALRQLLAPVDQPDAYELGLKAGAQLAVERIIAAVRTGG